MLAGCRRQALNYSVTRRTDGGEDFVALVERRAKCRRFESR